MAHFKKDSPEWNLVINALMTQALTIRALALDLCESHQCRTELEQAFPEMLEIAHLSTKSRIEINENGGQR